MTLSEKVTVVTGASQGIGEAIALEVVRSGSEAVLFDIQEDKLGDVVKKIQGEGGNASAYAVDVTNLEKTTETINKVIQEHKRIDNLVNNAGITRDSLMVRMKEEDWDAVLTVNLKGVFNLSKAVIRHMMSNRFGRIVNISSVVGLMGNAGQTNYSASKAGVIGLTKSLAREVASRGVTVNAVAPGYIQTAMTDSLADEVKTSFMEIIPIKRFGKPEEVAKLVKFLLSEEAAYITGQVISINGGMFM